MFSMCLTLVPFSGKQAAGAASAYINMRIEYTITDTVLGSGSLHATYQMVGESVSIGDALSLANRTVNLLSGRYIYQLNSILFQADELR